MLVLRDTRWLLVRVLVAHRKTYRELRDRRSVPSSMLVSSVLQDGAWLRCTSTRAKTTLRRLARLPIANKAFGQHLLIAASSAYRHGRSFHPSKWHVRPLTAQPSFQTDDLRSTRHRVACREAVRSLSALSLLVLIQTKQNRFQEVQRFPGRRKSAVGQSLGWAARRRSKRFELVGRSFVSRGLQARSEQTGSQMQFPK